MRLLRHSRFRLDWLPGHFPESTKPVKAPFPEEPTSSSPPPPSAEESVQDWERLWIDLGGEG